MSMDLSGVGGHFKINNEGWRQALMLAHKFGWEPVGTRDPALADEDGIYTVPDWEGHYDSNDGQEVEEEDGARIAEALEKALPDIPEQRIPKKGQGQNTTHSSGSAGPILKPIFGI